MRVYISGKITGLTKEDVDALFGAVEKKLHDNNHEAVNPLKVIPGHPDTTWEQYMLADIAALFECEAILMLPNWTDSKGARIEHAIAKEMGIPVFYTKNHVLY
jgi:hypothetical protein